MKRITTNNRAKILATIAAMLVVAILFTWGMFLLMSTVQRPEDAHEATASRVEPVVAPAEELPEVPTEPEAAELPAATSSVEAPKFSRQSAAAQPSETPAPLPYTDQMNTVGIAEADQSLVRSLVFTGFDWNVQKCACARAVLALASDEARLTHLNNYVVRSYGSWSAAADQARSTGSW